MANEHGSVGVECGSTADTGSMPLAATSHYQSEPSHCPTTAKPVSASVQHCAQDLQPITLPMAFNQNRILGRNINGTIAMTAQPSNESELQLYRVLQRANLLAYYDTFICQGGDDVQQLCEAGEEEFLEIMALVGMASKPLHVRRLQKALQEWITNPSLFQSPASAPFVPPSTAASSGSSTTTSNATATLAPANRNGGGQPSASIDRNASPSGLLSSAFSGNVSTPSPNQFQNSMPINEYNQPYSPISMTPVLVDSQIHRLADAADTLVKSLPSVDLKPLINGNKKRICKEIENIMTMSEDDPRRMEEIRKYAAIYGRFDCKRKPEKPLTLHEVSVNEAAAQICSKIPVLLYRRDELFPLARQVVRDSGYQYSKGHSRSQSCSRLFDEHSNEQPNKRIRLESSPGQEPKTAASEEDRKRRHDRLEGIVDQLKSLGNKQEEIKSQIQEANEKQNFQAVSQLQNELELITDHHMQLVSEKTELEKQAKRVEKSTVAGKHKTDGLNKSLDNDDTDSQFSLYSNESTTASILQEQTISPAEPTEQFCKKEKKRPTQSTTSSNDSSDFTRKPISEAEPRKEAEENIDLRLFNKYTEVLRNFGSGAENGPKQKDGPRPRGRPPKNPEFVPNTTFYEQILSQAQLQQMQLYQTHLQHSLQAQAALFGEYSLPVTNQGFGEKEVKDSGYSDLSKADFGKPDDKDEMASLNALMSINNNILSSATEHKHEISSVEFKIA